MNVLITGGTGSLGKTLVKLLLPRINVDRIVIYSRDELKQWEMQKNFNDPKLRYFIGDVRDLSRLDRAMKGIDVVIHTAAMKQVPACEYQPFEAVKTNIIGAQNVIDTSISNEVARVIALSTDKAVDPVNHYGATKKTAEGLFIAGNVCGNKKTIFSNVRYGNVLASRGSVVQLFKEQAETGRITITDPRMTRFWWTLDEAANFVLDCLLFMKGGETFAPKIKASSLLDLAACVAPQAKYETIGIRPGEKLHEILISPHEVEKTYNLYWGAYAVYPEFPFFSFPDYNRDNPVLLEFKYTSDAEEFVMTKEELNTLIKKVL